MSEANDKSTLDVIIIREPEQEDINYEDGYPANIDWKHDVVLQITSPPCQSVILYTCTVFERQTRSFLGYEEGTKFKNGLYIFTA